MLLTRFWGKKPQVILVKGGAGAFFSFQPSALSWCAGAVTASAGWSVKDDYETIVRLKQLIICKPGP